MVGTCNREGKDQDQKEGQDGPLECRSSGNLEGIIKLVAWYGTVRYICTLYIHALFIMPCVPCLPWYGMSPSQNVVKRNANLIGENTWRRLSLGGRKELRYREVVFAVTN